MIDALGDITKESFSFEMVDTYRTGDEFVGDAPQFDDITMLGIKWCARLGSENAAMD